MPFVHSDWSWPNSQLGLDQTGASATTGGGGVLVPVEARGKNITYIHEYLEEFLAKRSVCLLGMIVLLHISTHKQMVCSDVQAVDKVIDIPAEWWD